MIERIQKGGARVEPRTILEVDQPLGIEDRKEHEGKNEKPEDELEEEKDKNLGVERL